MLHDRALTLWRNGRLTEAEADFRTAIEHIETIRSHLASRENRAAFVQDKVLVYKDFVTFLEAQGRLAEAFHFTERARSRSLTDLLFTTQQDNAAAGADETLEQFIEAERRRQTIAGALAGEDLDDNPAPDPARTAALMRAYAEADSLYRTTLLRLRTDRPLGALLAPSPLTAGEARALLRPDEALLAYQLRTAPETAAHGTIQAYVLTRDTLFSVTLPIDPVNLSESIRFFRDQITTPGTGEEAFWRNTGRRLYEHLLAPLLARLPDSIRHLHIVPEGPLHYLPFAALPDASGRFLVERYTLSTTPSASVLQIVQAHNPHRWRSILIVADPADNLPGSRREAARLAALPGIQAHPLVGAEATHRNVLDEAGRHDVLHFATHGRFMRRAPGRSHLELHDAPLNVADIGRLRLNAYLVTLSACETALGSGRQADIPAGDEWIGLHQAFLAAGTPDRHGQPVAHRRPHQQPLHAGLLRGPA
ncbi:MAG: hypothetical protein KatS3mg043_2172 [Rhodothermaceae bacterium]|nr:MAG: hypothetical protein KatS3mg043_2172 [Rhodothermaceae bacterium]